MTEKQFENSQYSAQMHVVIEGVSYGLMGVDFENYAFGIANDNEPEGIEWFKCQACEIPELKEAT
jgi:hypothetical protein